jgi:hypothetical protein
MMAANERAFWAAPIGLADPKPFSVNDVRLRAFRAETGLTNGSVQAAEKKFYCDRLAVSGVSLSVNDLEKKYYASLGIDTTGGLGAARKKFFAGNMSVTWVWTP